MENDRFYLLISRRLSGEATSEELEELASFLRENPGRQYFADILANYWKSAAAGAPAPDADPDGHFRHILEMADDAPVTDPQPAPGYFKRIWFTRISIAATLVVIAGTVAWFSLSKGKAPVVPGIPHEFVAQKGSRSRISLPDGSTVLLNSATNLRFNGNFTEGPREVYLDGEAFFEVVKDPGRPFVVHTSGMQIKVLGTAFNVKAYSVDDLAEASLIHGSIEVSVKNRPNEKIILSPNEKLIVHQNETKDLPVATEEEKVKPEIAINQLKPDPIDSGIVETKWTENKLVFRNESFSNVMEMLERWYDVSILVEGRDLESTLLNGTFTNETVEEALDALALTKSFRYRRDGNQITIYK